MAYMCDSWLDQVMSFEESWTQVPSVNWSEGLSSHVHLGEPAFNNESHDNVAGSRGKTGGKGRTHSRRYGTRHSASGALYCSLSRVHCTMPLWFNVQEYYQRDCCQI